MFVFINSAFSQSKYWLFFRETSGNHQNIKEKSAEFFKVNKLTPLVESKWLNGVSVVLDKNQLEKVKRQSWLKSYEKINGFFYQTSTKKDSTLENNDITLNQIKANALKKAGFTGKNVKVGIIDGGFYEADTDPTLQQCFKNKQVVAFKDFINPAKTNFYHEQESPLDFHGTEVMKYICGLESAQKMQYGMATDAQFYLVRTENGGIEFRMEEDNWIAGVEWLHSQGVRLINSSLGYADGFTNPDENHKVEEVNGRTIAMSRFANLAATEKGMIIIVAAGNEGDNVNWRVLSAPADAENILSVGATNFVGYKMGYSSIGPENLEYLKPNISCFSLSGTSFSAPIITGLAACMLEYDSTLTNKKIFEIIEKSGNLYPFGNNFVGYGVPNSEKILKLLKGENLISNAIKIEAKGNSHIFEFFEAKPIDYLIFWKKDKWNVIKQKYGKSPFFKLEVKKEKNAKFTTVDLGEKGLFEIEWR